MMVMIVRIKSHCFDDMIILIVDRSALGLIWFMMMLRGSFLRK